MTGTVTGRTVAARLALRALGRRLTGKIPPAPDLEAFRNDFDRPRARVPAGSKIGTIRRAMSGYVGL